VTMPAQPLPSRPRHASIPKDGTPRTLTEREQRALLKVIVDFDRRTPDSDVFAVYKRAGGSQLTHATCGLAAGYPSRLERWSRSSGSLST
jgi:hypothetical protein